MTVTTQQRNILNQLGDPVLEPRKAFKRDLRNQLQTLMARGDEIILVVDFNETIDEEFNGLGKIVADFQRVDLMRRRSEAPLPATYARGNRRLDFGLATRTVATALKFAGYEAFNERFPTDHRAYFFDFDTDKLFVNATQVLAPPPMRISQSHNIKQVIQFLREKYKQLDNCNAFRRRDQLEVPGNKRKIYRAGVYRCKSCSTSPSVRSSTKVFCESRFGSLFPIESRFGSLRVSVLIIISRHCSSDIVECSADKLMRSATASRAQKRTQIGASPNAYFTCFISQSIHLGFSIFQQIILPWDSEELTKNNQRTTKEHEEQQGKCSFRALIRSFQFHFLHVFMISQLVYRNI
jgi:hypothetical protein